MSCNVKILDRERVTTTRFATQDRWDCDDTSTEHEFRGFVVVGGNNYFDLTIPSEPEYDTTYLLLYALYKTGCSFCTHTGKVEFIGLYPVTAVTHAEENIKRINANADTQRDFSVELLNEQGQQYTYSVPWAGYFERLEHIGLEGIQRNYS